MNYKVWDNASDEAKRKAPVIYTTPGFVDYAWCAHDRIGTATIEKLKLALISLHRRNEADRTILDAWSAQAKFVLGGKGWLDFYMNASGLLITSQSRDGSFEGSDGGDVFGTAIALLVLQMPYQRVSVYQR